MIRLVAFLVLPFAVIAAAIGFLTIGPSKGRWLPNWPTTADFTDDMPPLTWKTANHWLKNIAVEIVKKDPEYWAKCFSFVTCVLLAFLIL